MPTFTMLIGLPGSGKSTWSSTQTDLVLSTDAMIDEIAKERGMTYSEVFQTISMKTLTKKMEDQMIDAFSKGQSVILDRTNMSIKSRERFLKQVPTSYKKVARVFILDDAELRKRLKAREATGKVIPEFVLAGMQKSYEAPTLNEFDEVIHA